MIKIFGIRHHGPGSALRLREGLERWSPEAVLLELPADLQPALAVAEHPDLKPPVALLGYDPKQARRAAYLPFARFSPEWQALRYALEKRVIVRAIDLPLGRMFSLQGEEEGQLQLQGEEGPEARRMRQDPLSFLAELAGYQDSERWWEVHFEQVAGTEATFELILETLTALRGALEREESRETLAREAFMRQQIRAAQAEGLGRIAVVCGAWHAPVLHRWEDYTLTADKRALRGLRKAKVAATWIPWSYDRLARRGGYRAGVVSPAWYDLLFHHRREATTRWMSRASQLLRQEGFDSSPAQATEAVRLAESLAGLRRRALPGLQELEDAALAVFCGGDRARLDLIHRSLAIGDRLGSVPRESPAVPLQRDLVRCIKSARLSRERNTTRRISKDLDLRTPSNRLASQLLHRLHLLDIPWGVRRAEGEDQLGSFRESWKLKWRPEFAIRLIERGMLGNTVRQAAATALLQRARSEAQLGPMIEAAEEALHANLPEVFDELLLLTRKRAAVHQDIELLMDSVPPLVRIWRYGDVRQTDTEAASQLLEEMLPRIAIGLPAAAFRRQEEAARHLFERVLAVHHAMSLLDREDLLGPWTRSLEQLADRQGTQPLLQGLATRLLFDLARRGAEPTAQHLSLALSTGEDPLHSALWLEGFLHGSGLLLLHHPVLWQLLDQWVDRLAMDRLPQVLPLLRRAFATFSPHERRILMRLAIHGPDHPTGDHPAEPDEARARLLQPVLDLLLGGRAGEEGRELKGF